MTWHTDFHPLPPYAFISLLHLVQCVQIFVPFFSILCQNVPYLGIFEVLLKGQGGIQGLLLSTLCRARLAATVLSAFRARSARFSISGATSSLATQ